MSNTKTNLEKALSAYLNERKDMGYDDVVDNITKAIESYYKRNDWLTQARNRAAASIMDYAEAIYGKYFEQDEYHSLYKSINGYLKEIEEPLMALAKMDTKEEKVDENEVIDKILRDYLKTC